MDLSIRAKYPSKASNPPKDNGKPKLPVLKTYPDPAALENCPHGSHDGLCAICEKTQRERMVPAAHETENDSED